MSKFKVGDWIVTGTNNEDTAAWCPYEVIELEDDGTPVYIDDVGDECLALATEGWSLAALSPNDIVRLKSGETFTTGSFTAEVDSTKGDIVLLKHGSWLAVDAVEKVEAWVPEGDGWIEYRRGGNPVPGAKVQWLLDWERRSREFTPFTSWSDDLLWTNATVAYRVVEPAPVPAAEPAAETKPKFKVGDRVRVNYGDKTWDSTIVAPKEYGFVVSRDNGGWPAKEYGNGLYWFVQELDLSPLTELPEATYAGKILSLEEDGRGLKVTLSVDTSSLQADLADQFQRIADALRAA